MYDHDIPTPKVTGNKPGRKLCELTRLLIDCPVGACFFFPGKTAADIGGYVKNAKKLTSTHHRYTARTVTEDGVAGVRVWRLE